MFNKIWSNLFMVALALGIVLVIVLVAIHTPLVAPYVTPDDLQWLQFKLSFLGG